MDDEELVINGIVIPANLTKQLLKKTVKRQGESKMTTPITGPDNNGFRVEIRLLPTRGDFYKAETTMSINGHLSTWAVEGRAKDELLAKALINAVINSPALSVDPWEANRLLRNATAMITNTMI